MCGIAGVLAEQADRQDDITMAVQRMMSALVHRGPDDSGFYQNGPVTLGNRRLAILDLSATGHQPMANEDGSVWVTYNGEIYNFGQLRKDLLKKGHRFRSLTDTEVILHLYEEKGEGCLNELRGMFAFALWDQKRKSLLLARDRFGIKPLYYYQNGGLFVFASEVKALLASGLVSREINPEAVKGFLTLGSVPEPLTIIKGIHSLPPGCFLRIRDGKTTVKKYWEITFKECGQFTEEETAEQLRLILRECIRLHQISDVPLGVFLSGGIDSSAIVALLRQESPGRLRTLTIASEDIRLNEGPQGRQIAKEFDTEHIEHLLTDEEGLGEIDKIFMSMDQPTIDGINTYFVSKMARETGTIVALSGLGADELFGGYSSFKAVPMLCRMRAIPGIPTLALPLLRWVNRGTLAGRINKLTSLLSNPPSVESAYMTVRGLFMPEDVRWILNPEFWEASDSFNPLSYLKEITANRALADAATANLVSLLEARTYMVNQLLRDTDMMSMAHSLEIRVPFLDHVLAEFVMSVPQKHKFGRRPKRLLVKAMEGLLPEKVTKRRKVGFALPFDRWLRGAWRPAVEETIEGEELAASKIFHHDKAKAVWRNFIRGRLHWSRPWALVVMSLWWRYHISR